MKIARYITDDKVSVNDKIIGSDGDKSNKTKNFPITGISNFVLGQLKNSGVVFRFSNGATPGLEIGEPGYFFSESNIIDKTQLTKLYFSTDSFFGEELLELFSSVGSNLGELYLGLSQQDDSANYGFFNVVDAVNINDDYFEITVDLRGQMFAKQLVDGKNYSLFFDLASSTEYDIDIVGGVFQLLKNGAVYKTKDLSVYLDDTNLSRLTSGSVDENGIATFVRDDASSFTVDFSDFLSGITPTRTSHLINDGNGTSRYVTLIETYLRSEIDNKNATIQAQVTKLNGLKIERDTAQNRVNLVDGTGEILSWITDYNVDGMGYRIEFDADARTIYIIDSQGNIADTIPLSILVNDKLDKGNYPGTAETLKAEIDAIAGQLSSNAETRIIEFYEGHITGYEYNSTCKWVFDGVNFTKTKKLTFPAADPTNDMIGLWYADNAGDIGIVTGAPSANPVQPSLPDPDNQIQIKFIIIPAGSTEPAEISDITLYRENAQVAGGEANTSENTGGVRIALGSVNTPISQTKSIEATGLNTNDKFVLTPGATIPVAGLSALKYKIKNKVGVYSNANPLSIRLIGTKGFRTYTEYMPAPWQFGYNKDNSASVQDVSLPIPSLRMTDISAIEFVNNVSSDENFGFFIDEIGFNEGEDNTGGGTTGGVDQQYVDAADANLQSQITANDGELSGHETRIAALEAAIDENIDHEYVDIPAMIAGQNAQLEDDIIKVLDASGDPDVTSGKAYYFYDGTIAGTIDDYTPLTKKEIDALTAQKITTALGYTPADDSEVVKSVTINGTTYNPTAGNVDLGTISGGGSTPQPDYTDKAALLADQANQVEDKEYTMQNANGWDDPNQDAITHYNWATVKYLGTSLGTEADYELREQFDVDANSGTYDPTGETGENVQPDKTTVQTALREIRDWGNAPLKPLGDLVLPMEIDQTGVYNLKTLAANLSVSFANAVEHKEGNTKILYIKGDSVSTFTLIANDIDVIFDNFINGAVLSDVVMHRFAFTFLGSYIDVDYAQKELISIAPLTLESATIENASDSQINLLFSDPVNINTSGWTVTSDGDAIGILSVSGTGTISPVFQLDRSVNNGEIISISYAAATGNTIKVHTTIELTDISGQSIVNNVLVNNILVQDDFTGTTIDTAKWTISNPNSPGTTISQNGELIFTGDGTASSGVDNVNTIISATDAVAQMYVVASEVASAKVFGLWRDNSNRAIIARGIDANESKARLAINVGGTEIYNLTTSINLSGNTFKVVKTGNDISFFYLLNGTWTQLGITKTITGFGGDVKGYLGYLDQSTASAGNTLKYDNFYLSSLDYSTATP